jgi:hypothetical protein
MKNITTELIYLSKLLIIIEKILNFNCKKFQKNIHMLNGKELVI